MNNFDDIIKNACKREIEETLDYENMIKKAINSNSYKMPFFNKVAVLILSLVMSGTVVLATTYVVYEKIWKEPQKIDVIKDGTDEISLEQLDKYNNISSDDKKSIENIAKEYLKVIESNSFNSYYIELRDNNPHSDMEYYMVRDNKEYDVGEILLIEKKTKELLYYHNYDFDKKNVNLEVIPQELAENYGIEVMKKINIYDSNYECTANNNSNIWTLKYTRKNENDLENIYDFFAISFGIYENSLRIMTISNNKNNYYESNPIILTSEEAIKIAENKESELTNENFNITQCNLEIKKANTFFYQLENDIIIENENTYYKIDDIERNVWAIKIEHQEKDDASKYNSFDYFKKFGNKFYYIDATTGEIIGGSQAEFEFY